MAAKEYQLPSTGFVRLQRYSLISLLVDQHGGRELKVRNIPLP